MMFALVAAPAQARKKPDLVIARAALEGQRFAFKGERGRIFTHDITRNKGSASAGPSITEVTLNHGVTSSDLELAKRAVRRLGPGKQDGGDAWDPAKVYDYKIGAYFLEVCADATEAVRESNEENNCVVVKTNVGDRIDVYIIRRTWQGTMTGTAKLGYVNERWHTPNTAKLMFDKPLDIKDGVFAYDFAGAVTYEDSGSGGGCTYSGGDTQRYSPGGAESTAYIDYLRRVYGGSVTGSDEYSIRVHCGFTNGTYPGPVESTFFNADDANGPTHFEFGATSLEGNTSHPGATWAWNLR